MQKWTRKIAKYANFPMITIDFISALGYESAHLYLIPILGGRKIPDPKKFLPRFGVAWDFPGRGFPPTRSPTLRLSSQDTLSLVTASYWSWVLLCIVICLLGFSLLVTTRQYVGNPIDCVHTKDIPEVLYNTYNKHVFSSGKLYHIFLQISLLYFLNTLF